MWYLIIIFIIIFQAAVSIFAPSFPGITTTGEGITTATANTTSELIAAGVNPFSTFIDIMTFQAQGAAILATVFILLDVLLVLCVIKLIRGS